MGNNRKRKNSLFALEQALFGNKTSSQKSHQPKKKQQKQQKRKKSPKQPQEQSRAYDFDDAIELQYDSPDSYSDYPEAVSFSAPSSFASELEDESLPFTVEAFEADEEVEPISEPATPQSQTTVQPEVEQEVTSEQMEVQPIKTTVVPASEMPLEPTRSVKQPTTVESTTSEAEFSEDRAFAKDLQAILNGQKTYDAEEKQVVSNSSSTTPSVSPAHPHDIFDKGKTTIPSTQPIEPEPAPTSRSHAVFDQIGQNMAHATDFDQGTVDLSLEQSFDEFDRILDTEESKPHEQPIAQMMADGELDQGVEEKTSYTVCFCGTACTRDEGEVTRKGSKFTGIGASHKDIYSKSTGYIPVRIHKEISDDLKGTDRSVTIRGVGVNDWHDSEKSEALNFDNIKVPNELLEYVKSYSGKNQKSQYNQMTGKAAVALALHGANQAVASDASQYNFIGHSRGAVECIIAAWFLYAYGGDEIKNIPINIFAIDPVPGPGEWYGIFTQLPPNVNHYVGIYAWDHLDRGFTALVPRPNTTMSEEEGLKLGNTWKTLADNYPQLDPLLPDGRDDQAELPRYELFACRGKHGTVSGNTTADGKYNPENLSAEVERVPKLVYQLARIYLAEWGTTFLDEESKVEETVKKLSNDIHESDKSHKDFDVMGGGTDRNSKRPNRPNVRRVSSSKGKNPMDTSYLEDVVGTPPEGRVYPVTKARDPKKASLVKWTFL